MDLSVDKQSDVLATSPAGDHYRTLAIEPIQYIEANKLSFHEGAVVKYVSRWRLKNGIEDLKKARFYLDRMIQLEERRKPEPALNGSPATQNDMEDAIVAAAARSGMGHEPTRAAAYDSNKERFIGDPGDQTVAQHAPMGYEITHP